MKKYVELYYRALLLFMVTGLGCAISENSIASTHQLINSKKSDDLLTGRSFSAECSRTVLSSQCFKLQALSFIEDVSSKDELPLMSGLSVVKEKKGGNEKSPEQVVAELARAFPDHPDERIDRYLVYRLASYVDSHSLRFKLSDDGTSTSTEKALAGEEGRGKGGKGGGLGQLLAAGLMMKSTLAAAALGGLALLAGKALMTALISLLLSAIVGLKSLTHKEGKTTYEIITKPVIHTSHSQSSSHENVHSEHGYGHSSSYGRSLTFDLPNHMKAD